MSKIYTPLILILTHLGFLYIGASYLSSKKPAELIPVNESEFKLKNPYDFNFIGKADYPVRLVKLARLDCKGCASMNKIIKEILTLYKDKIYYSYRPITLRKGSGFDKISKGLYAAGKLGIFWDYIDYFYSHTNEPRPWSHENLNNALNTLKISEKLFNRHVNLDEARHYIENETKVVQGIRTKIVPTLIINGKMFVGPKSLEELKSIINKILNEKTER
ncbi:MAG: DsbA family protein [Spirochaetota bacterium]|nr:DsbA family protein [Spirochaetota bacterium]